MKPRRWEHKQTKKQVRVMPWWEIPEPVMDEKDWAELTGMSNVKAKLGVLVQVGWLIENEHGVWLGVGSKAAEVFNDLGEWGDK